MSFQNTVPCYLTFCSSDQSLLLLYSSFCTYVHSVVVNSVQLIFVLNITVNQIMCAFILIQKFGDFCKVECPANSYPPHATLLQEPISFNASTFSVIPTNRQANFSGPITFFAKFSQAPRNKGFLLFYGNDNVNINFGVEIDSSNDQGFTQLNIYSYSDGMHRILPLPLNQRLDDGANYCLTIVLASPLEIYIDGDLVPQTQLRLIDIDLNFGVSVQDIQ